MRGRSLMRTAMAGSGPRVGLSATVLLILLGSGSLSAEQSGMASTPAQPNDAHVIVGAFGVEAALCDRGVPGSHAARAVMSTSQEPCASTAAVPRRPPAVLAECQGCPLIATCFPT